MNRFFVFPRVRRNEFRYGIVNNEGREIGNVGKKEDADQIVKVMNENAVLNEEKIADLELKGSETLWPHWQVVREAIRCRI